ncbi:MAG: hypothetical protein K2F77_02665 [Muribaculaceae bacterium]|nr:hypothetical protein [Muribaculaceae bacterium]
MEARYIAVLEIGSSKVKGAVARTESDGGATIVAAHEVKTIDCVRHGRVQNVQEVAERVSEVLRRLENEPAVAPRRLKRVRIAFGGRSLTSVSASTQATLPAEVQITDDIIERLKKDLMLGLPADRQVVDVLPRSYNVDGAGMSEVVGTYGRNIHADMTVLLVSPDNRTNLERVRINSDDRPVERIYVPRQLAIARMALTPSEQQLGVVLVDLGAETTTVSIHRGGVLQALATLPMGGRNITRDIASGLSTTEEQAEHIKCTQASAMQDNTADCNQEAREINGYSQARAGEIIANVLHRIEQAGFKASELTAGIVLTGRAAQMRRMAELFETQTRMKVRVAPADNSVRPGRTGLDPIDALDIMALIAWPVADNDSDLTEPAKAPIQAEPEYENPEEEYGGYDPQRAANAARRRGEELDDSDVLKDDPDDDFHENTGKRKWSDKNDKKKESEPIGDDPDEGEGGFSGLRRFMSKFTHAIIGTQGPQDIDD